MRTMRSALAVCILLLAIPSWGKQPSQNTSTPQPASDPQAVAVVQAAITALGGATAIGQVQNWTFQAQMEGLHGNGNTSYILSGVISPQQTTSSVNGATKRVKAIRSFFVPAVLGYVLLNELQNQDFPLKFSGQTSLGAESVKVVTFSDPNIPALPAQRWYFDTGTNLPFRIEFIIPAVVGSKISFSGLVEVSNYQTVAGVLYPFNIVTIPDRGQREVLVLQSVSPNASTLSNDFNPIGDE